MVPKITRTRCFQGYHKNYIFKIIKQNLIMFLSWSSWKSDKDIFFEYFPRPKFTQGHSPWDLIFIWNESLIILRLTYSTFTRSLEFSNKSEKHSLRENCPYSKYSGPHFHAFGLNTERYSVSLCIQSECGKMRTRITPNTDTFHAVTQPILTMFSNVSNLCIIWPTRSWEKYLQQSKEI